MPSLQIGLIRKNLLRILNCFLLPSIEVLPSSHQKKKNYVIPDYKAFYYLAEKKKSWEEHNNSLSTTNKRLPISEL
jgi:hypothetical protein